MKTQLVALFLLLITFQACTPVKYDTNAVSKGTLPSTTAANSSSGGNGEYYGGKPHTGLYVRTVAGMSCGSSENAGEILIDSSGIHAKIVDLDTCAVTQEELSSSDLEFAFYDRSRIGFRGAIFNRVEASGSMTSNEVWCRTVGSTPTAGLDVAIEADYASGSFLARVVSGSVNQLGQVVREEYGSVSVIERRIEVDRARYRSDVFELDLDRTALDSVTGTYPARFRYRLDGHDIDRPVVCRTGGVLDDR